MRDIGARCARSSPHAAAVGALVATRRRTGARETRPRRAARGSIPALAGFAAWKKEIIETTFVAPSALCWCSLSCARSRRRGGAE